MLEEVMLNLDKDGSGTLDWDEFKIVALKVTPPEQDKYWQEVKHYIKS